MEPYEEGEVWELGGSHLLNRLTDIVDKESVGLYRDDGLGILQNLLDPQRKLKTEVIVKVFKDCRLRIWIQASQRIVNFLDLKRNLFNCTYQRYGKPDNNPVCLDKNCNHPTTILKKSLTKGNSSIPANLH